MSGDVDSGSDMDAPAGMERLWAGWRIPYIKGEIKSQDRQFPPPDTDDHRTLFEQIEQSRWPDRQTYVLWRGETCFAVLNAFPYSSGHLMVLPKRGVASLALLTEPEHHELWRGVRCGTAALEAAYSPQGVNVGINLGAAAGAGVPNHLHVHCVPRWSGDTNFMTSVAETRVLPESLDRSWELLVAAWPEDPPSA